MITVAKHDRGVHVSLRNSFATTEILTERDPVSGKRAPGNKPLEKSRSYSLRMAVQVATQFSFRATVPKWGTRRRRRRKNHTGGNGFGQSVVERKRETLCCVALRCVASRQTRMGRWLWLHCNSSQPTDLETLRLRPTLTGTAVSMASKSSLSETAMSASWSLARPGP